MRNLTLVVFVFFGAILVAHAEPGYAYGLSAVPGGTLRFMRVDLSNPVPVVVNPDVPHEGGVFTESPVIDHQSGYYIYRTEQSLVVLDLSDGHVVKHITGIVDLWAMKFDPLRRRLLGIYQDVGISYLAQVDINTETVIPLGGIPVPTYQASCGSAFDYHNNVIVTRDFEQGDSEWRFSVFDVESGEKLNSYLFNNLYHIAYDPVSRTIIGLTRLAEPDHELLHVIRFDALSGTIVSINASDVDGAANCSQSLDWMHNRYVLSRINGDVKFVDIGTGSTVSSFANTIRLYGLRVHNSLDQLGHARASGRVAIDVDKDCSLDAGDTPIPHAIVKIEPGPIFAVCNSEGEYSVALKPDSYEFNVLLPDHWRTRCVSTPRSVVLVSDDDVLNEIDFPLEASADITCLDVSIVSSAAVVGREIVYHIVYRNTGTLPYTGKLQFCHDDKLLDFKSDPAADRYAGNVAEWKLVDVPVGGVSFIKIRLTLPPDPELRGTSICAKVAADLDQSPDLQQLKGFDEICDQVRASYDPNDMRVSPAGVGPEGEVTLVDTLLTYVVRFQNVGDAAAQDVRILDTLSEHLNLASLRIGAASHGFELSILKNNVLEWRFDNIMLPPKRDDEKGSNGFLKYSIHIESGSPVGTVISNRAAIYFDFNKPILTNTVRTTLTARSTSVPETGLSEQIRVSSDAGGYSALIKSSFPLSGTLQIYDVVGQLVRKERLQAQLSSEVNLAHLTSGRYYLRFVLGEEIVVKSLTLVR